MLHSTVTSAFVVLSSCLLQHVHALQHREPPSAFGYFSHEDPPPRVGHAAAIDAGRAAISIKQLQDFVASSSESYASVLTMGDSTMSGLVEDFLNITQEVHQSRWLLHTTNDRPKSVQTTNDGSVVEPGGEWWDPAALNDPVAALVLQRARAANSLLHSQKCTWAGGVETFMMKGGPLDGLVLHFWGFIPEYGDTCWRSCMGEAVKTFQPSAVLWNVGFHLLNHRFDSATCNKRQNMAKENCADYKQLVTMGTKQLLQAAPIVIWRTTNWLCESIQVKHVPQTVKDDLREWEDASNRPSLEKACHENCDKMDDFTCYDWLMSARSTQRLYTESMAAIDAVRKEMPTMASKIKVLNTYAPTQQCCQSGCHEETEDGEHYRGLDRGLVADFAALLSK